MKHQVFPRQSHYAKFTWDTSDRSDVHAYIQDLMDWYSDQLLYAEWRDNDAWMNGPSTLGYRRWRLACWKGVRRYLGTRNAFPNFAKPVEFGHMTLLNSMLMVMPKDNPADKLRVANHIPEAFRNDVKVADVVRVYDDPSAIDFEDIPPGSYFLKSNHASMQVRHIDLRPGAEPLDLQDIREEAADWVAKAYGKWSSQWWYSPIERKVFLERDLRELVGGIGDEPLADMRFHVINGKTAVMQYDMGFGTGARDNPIYDRDLNYLPYKFLRANQGEVPLPANALKARDIAEAIAKWYQYVRVDFYAAGDQLFLGELTFLPNGGLRRVQSKKLNEYLCSFWDPMPKVIGVSQHRGGSALMPAAQPKAA